jgi:hypothetical protein
MQVAIDPWLKTVAVAAEQLPYVLSSSVNQMAKLAQEAVRQHVKSDFVLRKASFVLNTVKITHFSDKRDADIYAEIRIQNPEGDKRDPVLARFEDGTQKTSFDPTMPLAIPTPAIRPAFADLVPLALYPKNLRIVERRDVVGTMPAKVHVTKAGVTQIKGKLRTFVLDPKEHFGVQRWGVFQRTGPGRHDVRMIWLFKSKEPIPARLAFAVTIKGAVAREWQAVADQKLAAAMRSAR